KQKITKFFIKGKDEGNYQQFLDSFLEETLNSPNASVEEKTELVTGQSETAIDRLKDDPGNETCFDMTRKAAKNLQKLIFENPESLNNVFGAEGETGPVVQHCINVAALSIKFAKAQNVSEEEIDFLSTAALMHDIGVLQMDDESKELFHRPKLDLTAEDKKKYYEHCKGVVQLLSERPYINNQIIELIESHEENLQGSGPLKKGKLTKPQEILSMVNAYDKKIIAKKILPTEAIKEMMIDELGNYNLDLLTKFQNFLKSENVI
ncbi:MAG: HDIG domain-containing protein, partial [Halobacteriovoraceae bacterium]|nr:HDIG domain-containing protein [Halobacteriovoraceae bacterium]